jgi:hypothetical protein
MKKKFIDKNFAPATLKLIDQANNIIAEYLGAGMRLTLRQLYYQFVSRDLIANQQKEYKRLGAILSDARLAGLVDWSALEDRTRSLRGNTHWDNPGQIVRAAARTFRLDHWEGQSYRPEVWIEKEALSGVIAGICNELDVDYFACKGYVSQSEMYDAAMRLISYAKSEGQIPVIIHLGDHDPSGIDMTRDIIDRQDTFLADVEVKRIALNMDQVLTYSPPPNPAKVTDSRCAGYIEKYGRESWELDALEPKVLRRLIKDTVLEYRDEAKYREVMELEEEYKDVLARVERDWETL